MSIEQYFTKFSDMSRNEESSDMDFSSEQETNIELQKSNHEYITKNYKKTKKKMRLSQIKKTGNFQKNWLGLYL
jgi:hypothetical protein